MLDENALSAVAEMLKDESGDEWPSRKGRFVDLAARLSQRLEPEDVDGYLWFLGRLAEEEVRSFQEGVFVLAVAVVEPFRPWSAEALGRIQSWIRGLSEENDQVLALVGSPFRVGFHTAFESAGPRSEYREVYGASLGMVRGFRDEERIAWGLERLPHALHTCGDEAWVGPFYGEIFDAATGLSNPSNAATALSGMLRSLSDWPSASWADDLIRRASGFAVGLTEDSPSRFSNSPKAALIRGLINLVTWSERPVWADEALAGVHEVLESFGDDEELQRVFGALGELAAWFVRSAEDPERAEMLLDSLDRFRDDKLRGEALARFADDFGEECAPSEEFSPGPAVYAFFDRLTERALEIEDELARAQALTYSVWSIAQGLRHLAPSPEALRRIVKLARLAPELSEDAARAELLGNLAEVLEEQEDDTWCDTIVEEIVSQLETIHDGEALGDALSDVTEGFAKASGGRPPETAFRRLLELAEGIATEMERSVAIYGRHGIAAGLVARAGEPWAVDLLRELAGPRARKFSEEMRALALEDFAGENLAEIQDSELFRELVRAVRDQAAALRDSELAATVFEGLVACLAKTSLEELQERELRELFRLAGEQEDDVAKVRCLLASISGTTESTLDHSLRGKPWLPDLYREILDRIRTIESPEFRYAVLAGDLYIVATWKSVALAMRDLADPGWKGFYLEMIRAAGEIAPGPARLAAYLGIAEQAFGDDEIHRELQGAPWLAAALLRTLNGALGALGEAYDELSNGDRKEATRHLAQSIRLLDSRIGAGPAGETRERVPDEVLRDAFERSSALTEETYVERFPFSDDERYSLIPRLAFLECLLREMEGRGAASLDALFEEAIRAILRVRASYQAELWRALIRVLSTAEITPEERSRLYGRILDSDLPAPVQQAALSSLVLALGRDDRIDEALELAGRLDAPDEEYERLWNLAMMQPEPDPRIQGRLRELAAALGRDVHGPEAAGSGAARSRDPRDYDFDVAISYSGADRGIAEQLVTSLRDKGLRVYFDRDFQEELWGRRLAPALRRIYGSRALYCILLLSETYPRSSWARQEYAVLRERADEEGEPHLIPVLLDREKKPDLEGLDQLAYIDFREIGLEGLSKMVVRRVLGAGR